MKESRGRMNDESIKRANEILAMSCFAAFFVAEAFFETFCCVFSCLATHFGCNQDWKSFLAKKCDQKPDQKRDQKWDSSSMTNQQCQSSIYNATQAQPKARPKMGLKLDDEPAVLEQHPQRNTSSFHSLTLA